MPNYGRDLDIGVPTAHNLAQYNEVLNFANVIAAVGETTQKMEEALEELARTRRANELILGQEVEDGE